MIAKRTLRQLIRWPLGLLAVMWLVFIVDTYLMGGLLTYHYNLSTRELAGLDGIITAPLLHANWGHLLSNSVPFLSLSGLLVFFYPRLWPRVLASLWIGTGVLVWTLGRDVAHIGASGVVYALAAFLAFSGIFRRDFRAVVVSLVVLFYYGGMVVGILPGQEGISWESHLLGLVMGVISAYLYRGELEDHEIERQRRKEAKLRERNATREPFLDLDTFELTKEERRLRELEKEKESERLRSDSF